MDEFLALFRDHVVPARQALGFQVVGAWHGPEDGTFVWVVGHEAPDGWEACERAYYESPERAALPRNPGARGAPPHPGGFPRVGRDARPAAGRTNRRTTAAGRCSVPPMQTRRQLI